jgi:hypothetical protein
MKKIFMFVALLATLAFASFGQDANTTKTPTAAAVKYKVLTAQVNQQGTVAPTMIVLENTLGCVPVWSYNQSGSYRLTCTGAFPDPAKVVILTSGGVYSIPDGYGIQLVRANTDYLSLFTGTPGVGVHDFQYGLVEFYIEVRVYQ